MCLSLKCRLTLCPEWKLLYLSRIPPWFISAGPIEELTSGYAVLLHNFQIQPFCLLLGRPLSGSKTAGITANSRFRLSFQALPRVSPGRDAVALQTCRGSPALSPHFGHVWLPSRKTSLGQKLQGRFLKEVWKVRWWFKRTPASALVFNKASHLPSGSAAHSGQPWLCFGWGTGVGPDTSHRSLCGRKQIPHTHKMPIQGGKAAPLAWCEYKL